MQYICAWIHLCQFEPILLHSISFCRFPVLPPPSQGIAHFLLLYVSYHSFLYLFVYSFCKDVDHDWVLVSHKMCEITLPKCSYMIKRHYIRWHPPSPCLPAPPATLKRVETYMETYMSDSEEELHNMLDALESKFEAEYWDMAEWAVKKIREMETSPFSSYLYECVCTCLFTH